MPNTPAELPVRKFRLWWIVPVIVVVLVVGGIAAAAIAAAVAIRSLASSTTSRAEDVNPDQLPILSQTHGVNAEAVSVAVTDNDKLWAWGAGGLGTNSRVNLLQYHGGEGYWEWAGELDESQSVLAVRESYRRENLPPLNRMSNVREGADTLCYVPAKDVFLWSNLTTGRLLCTTPKEITSDRGDGAVTQTERYRGARVLYHLERSPLCVVRSFQDDIAPPPSDGIRHWRNVFAILSPDGRQLAVATHGRITIWRTSDFEISASRKLEGSSVKSLDWSPSGKRLGVAIGDQAYMLGVETGH